MASNTTKNRKRQDKANKFPSNHPSYIAYSSSSPSRSPSTTCNLQLFRPDISTSSTQENFSPNSPILSKFSPNSSKVFHKSLADLSISSNKAHKRRRCRWSKENNDRARLSNTIPNFQARSSRRKKCYPRKGKCFPQEYSVISRRKVRSSSHTVMRNSQAGNSMSSSKHSSLNSTSQKVLCQVCSRVRDCGKYKRHLKMHVRQGKISTDDVEAIVFQSRYTRSTSHIKPHIRKTGKYCPIIVEGETCNRILLNLSTHLFRFHSISPYDKLHRDALKKAKVITKEIFYKNSSFRVKRNPLHVTIPEKMHIVTPQQVEKSIEIYEPEPEEQLSEEVYDDEVDVLQEYSFNDESDIDEVFTGVPSSIPNYFVHIIDSFRKYSSTIGGGCRSVSFLNMDRTNLMILSNSLGEDGIFDANKMNHYITQELANGKSPSTIQSRLFTLTRFLSYLKCFEPSILPEENQLNDLTCFIKGAGISLSKYKKKRQQVIISKTREDLPETVCALNQWREKRKSDDTFHLFTRYAEDSTLQVVECEYSSMRNYLIVELIIPNGQRPGVVHGVTISEIQEAKTSITNEGYHKLIVSNHKTGLLQSATLFIYPEVFYCLTIFVDIILPKLPVYGNNVCKLTSKFPVFQTFTGQALLSSRITPILRTYLSNMGIQFSGTITDLRKAAATLTGKFSPNLHELMAIFMCHSTSTHDRTYRIPMGHDGLTEAFNSLERFQSQSLDGQSREISVMDNSLERFQSQSLNGQCKRTSIIDTSLNRIQSQSFNNQSQHDFVIDNSPETYQSQFLSSQSRQFRDIFRQSASNFQQSESNCTTRFDSNQHLAQEDSVPSPNIVDFQPTFLSNNNLISTPISKCSQSKSNHLMMKEVEIHLTRNMLYTVGTRMHSLNEVDPHSCNETHTKKLFNKERENEIFMEVFDQFINRKNNIHVVKKFVIERAHNCELFAPILKGLYERFSEEIVEKKIINRVRTLTNRNQSSMKLRYQQFDGEHLLDIGNFDVSKDAENYLKQKKFNKSIFSTKQDEVIFRIVFSDLINRIAKRETVSKHDIFQLLTHKDFIPVYSRLKNVYKEDAILKIVSKVRTVGYSKRDK